MNVIESIDRWVSLERSPCCADRGQVIAALESGSYAAFGVTRISRPQIELARCSCGLIYKRLIPSTSFLRETTFALQQHAWSTPYSYEDEVSIIRSIKNGSVDLIDVGAAVGGLLTSLNGEGRRSALDIVRFDALRTRGEFIEGFLDAEGLRWSGDPYDIVTAFDIFEHLYDPNVAMRNVSEMLKVGGHLILETGDTDSVDPKRLGRWYYLNLFEHHVAWNEQSIRELASKHGFTVMSVKRKKHKLASQRITTMRDRLLYRAYEISPTLFRTLQSAAGAVGNTPAAPDARDHIRAVLRKSNVSAP